MNAIPAPETMIDEALVLRLAREIAVDLHPIENILENMGITQDQWEKIRESNFFTRSLESEVAAWNAATNTHERVKLKSAAVIEEWLPELYARLHDSREALNHKIEGAKLAARLAGMGLTTADVTGSGEKISIQINMGADAQLKVERDVTPRGNSLEYDDGEM